MSELDINPDAVVVAFEYVVFVSVNFASVGTCFPTVTSTQAPHVPFTFALIYLLITFADVLSVNWYTSWMT